MKKKRKKKEGERKERMAISGQRHLLPSENCRHLFLGRYSKPLLLMTSRRLCQISPPSTASGLAAGQVAQDQPSFATWPGAMSFPTPHLHKFGSRVGFLSVAQCSSAVHLICIGRSQAMWNIQWELICIRWPVTPDSCWFFDCQWVIVSFACREEILGNLHPFGQGSHLHRTARRCQIFKIGAVHAGRALIE